VRLILLSYYEVLIDEFIIILNGHGWMDGCMDAWMVRMVVLTIMFDDASLYDCSPARTRKNPLMVK